MNTNQNEVCPFAEGGCGNRDNSWCCGCDRDETGRLYQPEICPLAEGGCGNCDSSWCCGCARDDTGRLFQPEVCKVVATATASICVIVISSKIYLFRSLHQFILEEDL